LFAPSAGPGSAMPTYLYECDSCGEFEVEQAITAPPLARCPNCQGVVRRLIAGGTSFMVKGAASPGARCDREVPCCGRSTRCDKPPCGQ